MKSDSVSRRSLVRLGTLAAAAPLSAAAAESRAARTEKVMGVACSPRRGMTTAKAVQTALDAATSAGVEVELIDLGGLRIGGYSKPPPEDDFTPWLTKFQDPGVGGLMVGGDAPAFQGATVLSKDDDIAGDELGLDTCRKIGRRIARLAAPRVPGVSG